MWLLKAVGVHDQHDFTFALERGRTYTIGRDKGCNIQFTSKRLRVHEGSIEVGDWTTTEPDTKPIVKYRTEPRKGKTKEFPPYECLILNNEDDIGSTSVEDYEKIGMHDQGVMLSDNVGQGVYYADDAWFSLIWKDLYVVYDKMKDETDDLREALKSHCIGWSPSFETSRIPTYVFSATYKANQECNYAVCYGVRILLPDYLRDIVRSITGCWKTRADALDSFHFPDEESEQYRPPFDPSLQNFRANLDAWLPDQNRPTLFKGWKILVLRSKATPGERRFLLATGAEVTDCDVVTQPLLSAADFEKRLSPWVKEVDEHEGGREKAIVAFFGTVKKNITESGKDFTTCVEAPCHRLGLAVAPGSIIWHAVKVGGVRKYLEEAASNVPRDKDGVPHTRRTQIPETVALPVDARSLTPPPEVPSAGPSQPSPSQKRSVPGSVIDETDYMKPIESTAMDIDEVAPPPSAAPAPAPALTQPPASGRKGLKRRAGKPMTDLYVEPIVETNEDVKSQEIDSLERGISQPTEGPPSAQPASSQSYIPDSQPDEQMPSQTQGTAGARSSRLKRRAGTQQPIVDYTIPESAPYPSSTQDMAPEIKEIYDQATLHRGGQPPTKRARLASVDETMREATPADTQMTTGGGGGGGEMEATELTDGEEQLDFVERTLKQAAKAKKEGRQPSRILMPPPTEIPSRNRNAIRGNRSPSEESEPIEPPRKSKRAVSPVKLPTQAQASALTKGKGKATTETSSRPASTQDTAFLTAIARNAKSKRAVDELDKEFNQLRIPKPGANPGSNVVKASAWNADHPDWNLVNDFNDEMRGNFIQIVKMDLMRKDGGRRQPTTADDGRPNFKKFKKDIPRREPVRMVLANPATNDAEMGEPYWPTQQVTKKGKGGTQMTLTQQPMDEDDEDMPILPRSRRRLLEEDDLDDDITPIPAPSAPGRGARAAASETPAPSQARKAPATQARSRITQTQRQLRESSIASDASSTGTRSTRATRAPAASTQAARKGRAPAIVIEESEDEVNRDIGPARSSTGTATANASRAGRNASGAAASASGRIGDDEATTASASTRGKAQSSSLATGRRRLLVADDDDDGEMVFKGAAKKRRL